MLCDNNICSVHADKIKPSPHLEGFLFTDCHANYSLFHSLILVNT